MDTAARFLRRALSGPVPGCGLVLYVLLVPVVVVQRWASSFHVLHGALERILLVALVACWLAVVLTVATAWRRLRRGEQLARSGAVWLAGALLALLSFSSPAMASATPRIAPVATHQRAPTPVATAHSLTALLAVKRRRDASFDGAVDGVTDIDEVLASFLDVDLTDLATLPHFFEANAAGTVIVPPHFREWEPRELAEPVLICELGAREDGTAISFARVGESLTMPAHWSASDCVAAVTALHGRLLVAHDELSLLRYLVTEPRDALVLYLGAAPLEPLVAARCVRRTAATPTTAPTLALLRAQPTLSGLVEPFAPTLRRRCLEMVAYLTLHGDPVSGDRLRMRVLGHADVDASKGTLSNTATAVRRSLGSDDRGPRLHPVSTSGVYSLHGVTTDLDTFYRYCDQTRRDDTPAVLESALALVQGEPLSSVTRGFEWFVLEGHLAKLQRVGEWAALTLATWATDEGDVDLAFWALQQGLYLDPTSDALRDALWSTPRLGQLRRNGADASQHQAIRPGRAVAMSWSLERFGH